MRKLVTAQLGAVLIDDNSMQSHRHNDLWLEFTEKVKHIANNPRYKEIFLAIEIEGEDGDDSND